MNRSQKLPSATFTPRRFLLRSLAYHRGIHAAVALGVAVGTAVLAGALLVGDSVRGSLRDLTLDRLAGIDHAMVADRYFREQLADDLAASGRFVNSFDQVAPAILIRGSVQAASTSSRASRVNIHGVEERFWSFFAPPEPLPSPREVLINETLAHEIGAQAGDALIVRFQTDTLIPSESVMGRKSENVGVIRLKVAGILPSSGLGRFGLSPSQQLPFNVFLSLETLQNALEQPGRANALFVSGSSSEEGSRNLDSALKKTIQLADLHLTTRPLPRQRTVALETDRIVLDISTAEAAADAAREAGLPSLPVLTYLANEIRLADRSIPYSTVTALDTSSEALFDSLLLSNGDPAPKLEKDEILLNEWAARDLRASVGDEVELAYYVVGPQGSLETGRHTFSVKGVVGMSGLALDRDLAPTYKGMSDAARMGDWDPPFPVDLGKIRPIDEDYWDRYRTAPKAFISLETAKKLWTSRFGQLTSIRVAPTEGQTVEQAAAAFEKHLRARLSPAAYGLVFQPVKAQGLAASAGATDFSEYFFYFSFFLIVSATMLVVLLFRLGVERRSKEIGLLLATGQPIGLVRRLLLKESAAVALVGCLIGLPGAVGYAALMVYGLTTWWSAAVGAPFLELHVTMLSLTVGAVGALLMMVVSIWFAIRKLEQVSPRSMLAGEIEPAGSASATAQSARRSSLVGGASAALALLLVVLSVLTDVVAGDPAFFGVGALLLVAALAFFRSSLATPARASLAGASPLSRLGVRNGARRPTRSLLTMALVASSTFIILSVESFRHDPTHGEPTFHSGDGGFRWMAESDVSTYRDQLSFGGEEGLPEMRIFSLRVRPGEDASCLNLYRPSRPTLLGATPELIERGGFAFPATLAESAEEVEHPWRLLDKELEGGGVPVFGDANSVKYILHLGLGAHLEVADERGENRRLVIAGLLSRSVFQSQLIMSERNFLDLFPSHSGFNLFMIETDSDAAGQVLEQRFADQGLDATRTADRLAGYLVVENTYLSTFQALGGLGLLLGTLGLAVVMVRNVLERRAELALLQAVGFPAPSISWLVLAENLFLLVFGVLIGVLTASLAVLPHFLSGLAEPPWLSVSITLISIVLVGLIAGALSITVALHAPLAPALRRE